MNNFGSMYEEGHGVKIDYAQALIWYRKAVETGDANGAGSNSLGSMYEKGLGVPKDRAQAVAWYRKSAAAGNEDALKRLKELGEDTSTINPPH